MNQYLLLGVLAAAAAAQGTGNGYEYEERAQIGAYFEYQSIQDFAYEYKVMKHDFHLDMDVSPAMGITGYMPITNWFGLRAIAMFQKFDFNYRIYDTAFASGVLDEGMPANLSEDDFSGDLTSYNVIAQGTTELGWPIIADYNDQLFLKLYGFGGIVSGKNFLDDSKFQNGALWGLSGGAGALFSWGRLSLNGGLRYSHIYWRLYFDPSERTGSSKKDDTFMIDYNTIGPFVSATVSIY